MGSRHRKRHHPFTATRAAAALLAAGPAAVGVLLLASPSVPAVGSASQPKPVAQEGRVVAVSADSLTARSADGSDRTYVVTPQTASVTVAGGGVGTAAFDVNDEVSIVGVMRDGTAIATTVAAAEVSNLNGPPMDSIAYSP